MTSTIKEKINKKYMNIIRTCILKKEDFSNYLKYITAKDIDDNFLKKLVEDTINNYILHYNNCSEIAILKTSTIGKILESGNFDIDYNTGNILITSEIKENQRKEYQKTWYEKHDGYKKYIYSVEHYFLNKLHKLQIHGICFSCGETTFFIDSHHILGKKYNDMELSICIPCHYKYRGKKHCINIGKKIENLF